MDELTVDPTEVGGALVLALSRTQEAATAAEFTPVLLDATAALPPPSVLILDLRPLDGLTVQLISTLDAFIRHNAHRGVRSYLLVDSGGAMAQVLDTAEFGTPRFATLDLALAAGEAEIDVHIDDVLVSQFETLTRTLLTAATVKQALWQIVRAASIVVPSAALVSVTLRAEDGAFSTPAETDEVATELDQVQFRSGAGPCVDAALPAGPAYAVSEDLNVEQRWPQFAAAATAHGFGAVLSTELLTTSAPGRFTGALNIYMREPHSITAFDRHATLLLATHAALALAHVHAAELANLHTVQFEQALQSRDIIGQAKGILMNRQGITADEAFDLLRRTSQDLNVKLVDLATTVANRHEEFDLPG